MINFLEKRRISNFLDDQQPHSSTPPPFFCTPLRYLISFVPTLSLLFSRPPHLPLLLLDCLFFTFFCLFILLSNLKNRNSERWKKKGFFINVNKLITISTLCITFIARHGPMLLRIYYQTYTSLCLVGKSGDMTTRVNDCVSNKWAFLKVSSLNSRSDRVEIVCKEEEADHALSVFSVEIFALFAARFWRWIITK